MKTFRARLIAWNVLVVALALIGFGTLLLASSERQVMANIDRTLIERAQRGGPPPRGGRPDGFDRMGGPGGMGGERRPMRRENDPGQRVAQIRNPRWIRRDGSSFGLDGDIAPFHSISFDQIRRQGPDVRTIQFDGQRVRVATAMAGPPGESQILGQAAQELNDVENMFRWQRMTFLFLMPVALIAAAAAGLILANRALKPVEAMADAAEKIGEEDLSRRLPIQGEDEMGQLAKTFNALISRLEGAFSSQKAAYSKLEKAYEAQQQFTADASHELRTPLSRVKLVSSAALSQNATPEEKQDALRVIDRAADDMSVLVQDLLELARADASALKLDLQPVNVRQLAETVADEFRLAGAARIEVEGEGTLALDQKTMTRVMRNLISNAIRHTPEDGLVRVICRADGFEVADNGEGIPAEHLEHLSERFYRANSDRSRAKGGTGLGLAIVRALVEAHRGTMLIESVEGQGTRVIVRVPQSSP